MLTKIKAGTSAKKINKLFKEGGAFLFSKGTYDLDKTLVLYSDTIVTCEEGAVFNRKHGGKMLMTHVDKDTTGYNGVHNVQWTGGAFNAGTNESAAIVIVICHSKGIVFDSVTIKGCVNLHSIEINSSQKITIQNCDISDQTFKIGEEHKEAIQIDYAYKGGLSIKGATADSPCYDDTHCNDISIIKCGFTNVPNGIGTHVVSENETYHENIWIDTCNFSNIKGNAIRLLGMKDVSIVNCIGGNIFIDTAYKAHTNHGKVKIPTRYNKKIAIDVATRMAIKVE